MTSGEFIIAAINGNRKLRKLGRSDIPDCVVGLRASLVCMTMAKFKLNTIGDYLEECKKRPPSEIPAGILKGV